LENIPPAARQRAWPVVERHGFLYVFNGRSPRFELPFFKDCDPSHFVPARPVTALLACPWQIVGANAFDVQHFRAAHDRRLIGEPIVSQPHPLARCAAGTFEVAGEGWRDRVTRRFAGDRVTMAITDWCGNLMFATATFRRTTSYGMVITEPLGTDRVLVRVIVFMRRSQGAIARNAADPVRREIRRYFIKQFLREDVMRLQGAMYNPQGLVECDRHLIEYFRWLAGVASPTPGRSEENTTVSRSHLFERTKQSV
jgi:phenylpropionate dioxygenase-like ring-hydroxylating dioxygenase large terminal subunit